MSNYPTRLDICDGKYTLLIDMGSGEAECLRYGEKWRSLVGDKMVLALFDTVVEKDAELTQLRAEVAELRKVLEETRGSVKFDLLHLEKTIKTYGSAPPTYAEHWVSEASRLYKLIDTIDTIIVRNNSEPTA